MPTIKLKSSDDRIFDVDVKVAICSVTIKTMLEDLGVDDEGDDGEIISLPVVRGEILEMVIKWAEQHKDDPPQDAGGRPVEIGTWDTEFLNVDKHILFELTRAANYLDVKGLLDMTCKAVANLIKGKTPKEIRQVFDLPT